MRNASADLSLSFRISISLITLAIVTVAGGAITSLMWPRREEPPPVEHRVYKTFFHLSEAELKHDEAVRAGRKPSASRRAEKVMQSK
jgi:hypothetical protein